MIQVILGDPQCPGGILRDPRIITKINKIAIKNTDGALSCLSSAASAKEDFFGLKKFI